MQTLSTIATTHVAAALEVAANDGDLIIGFELTCQLLPTQTGVGVTWFALIMAKAPMLGAPPLVHADHLELTSLLAPESTLAWVRSAVEGLRAARARALSGLG
jgi:hypothetical protein